MPVTSLEAVAGNWSRDLGGDRSSGRLPCPVQGLSSSLARTPVSFPTYRAGSPRAQALRQEVEAMLAKGALEIARDPGPGFYSRLFLVEKATGGWRPVIDLSIEGLRPADAVQDGNSRFGAVVCQRGGFSSFLGSEGCALSDPDPWIIEEAVEVHVGGDSLPVQSPVLSGCRLLPRSLPESSRRCRLGLTLAEFDCSVTWTIGWFSPPRRRRPRSRSGSSSRFVAPSVL